MLRLKTHDNLLELIPQKNNPFVYTVEEDDKITLVIKRESTCDKFFLKIFRKAPKKLFVHLDNKGSFVWNKIDNKKNVLELAKEYGHKYGVKAEDAIAQTGEFIRILKNNKLIQLKNEN
ncbi:PqqD family protein [Anaerosalibacter massiliensis]|uniref:PqqD family protein n=1 Tax=Anaerosalibacter massiliensis TaxID=1347392 RepID=A0A9X2MI68_9FIRM|nr:PqqD family protein [Anaerosalibacter massiliensis]MCR2043632.1 PqqD family protein [Anaerosalibacter massiliensis]